SGGGVVFLLCMLGLVSVSSVVCFAMVCCVCVVVLLLLLLIVIALLIIIVAVVVVIVAVPIVIVLRRKMNHNFKESEFELTDIVDLDTSIRSKMIVTTSYRRLQSSEIDLGRKIGEGAYG